MLLRTWIMVHPHDAATLRDGLIAHGLLIPTGVPGVAGRGAVFEDVLARFDALVTRRMGDAGLAAEVVSYPPVLARRVLEQVDYLGSFPQLAGTVHSFRGGERDAKQLAARIQAGDAWGAEMTMTDVALTPAVCYPLYPAMAGDLPEHGRLITMNAWAFRHEPSAEPTRMQAFRVRELVRAGTPDAVIAWRDAWVERGRDLLISLGLPARAELAADPFFGRGGKVLQDGQRAQRLKLEVVIPVLSEEAPTAVCSFNYHVDKFGSLFGIRCGGATAHTACLGFGLERCAIALFRHHGFVPAEWPAAVRAQLWPS
jgi:seryl-tRNA synthetase